MRTCASIVQRCTIEDNTSNLSICIKLRLEEVEEDDGVVGGRLLLNNSALCFVACSMM